MKFIENNFQNIWNVIQLWYKKSVKRGRAMRKIINSPDIVVSEMMEGYISAYGRYYEKHPEVNGVILRRRRKDKDRKSVV